jgi:hypothetical protein
MAITKRLEVRQVVQLKPKLILKLLEQTKSTKRKIQLLTLLANKHPETQTRDQAMWQLRDLARGGNKPAQEFLTKRGIKWQQQKD